MHDIRAIRDDPAAFDRGLARRGLEPQAAGLVALDEQLRGVKTRLQAAQERRNAASKQIGRAKAAGDHQNAEVLVNEVAALKIEMLALEAEEKRLDEALRDALAVIPNIPADDVPDGADETANVELRRVGTPRAFNYEPKQHFELGEALGLMDFETAAKISGARFVVLKGALARMERALGQFMLDIHTGEHGYTETNPPLLVREHTAFGTGNLPKFEDDLFRAGLHPRRMRQFFEESLKEEFLKSILPAAIKKDPGRFFELASDLDEPKKLEKTARFQQYLLDETDMMVLWEARQKSIQEGDAGLYLTPTAEVSVTNYVRDSILDPSTLPLRYTAHTPCFRSEAGSAGRDTRGMIRQHQFMKVELVSITTPDESEAEHQRMLKCAETVLERLGLPFRTVALCTGDMGFASRKTYDIEVWLPGQGAYREISSCSNCGDFQARRMNARYRPEGEKGTRFVHTLNGSGVAVGRCQVAVLENYQEADGSITVPEALRPYMGGLERIARA
jgi:seryl-tRNA synthetase